MKKKQKIVPANLNRRKALHYLLGAGAGLTLTACGWNSENARNNQKNELKAALQNYSTDMILQRLIPVSGEKLPVIGLGTWQTFDAGTSESERKPLKEVLKLLVELGGKVVDSSPMYGRSEEVAGDLAAELSLHKSLFLATKVWTNGEKAGINQMNESMQLLKTQQIDLMQIHNLLDWQTHLKTLRAWKLAGKIRYIGITHYTVGAYPDLEKIIKNEKPDFVQFNYSIQTREAEKRLLPLAADKGVAVIINRPFEGGSLFSTVKGKSLPEWAKEFDCESWGQFFLKFIVSHPAVTTAIAGTSKPNHLKDNLRAGFGKLPNEKTRLKMIEFMRN